MRRLTHDTACGIRACARIPTLECIVLEHVMRSVGAGAQRIHVDVDVQAWRIVCTDNGSNIEGLNSAGLVLRPYMHGLHHTPFLACLPWICMLELHSAGRMLLQRGDCILYFGPSKYKDTRIVMHNVFEHVPVRRRLYKQKWQRTVRHLRAILWGMAFAHPKVTFSGLGARIPASHRMDVMLRRLQPNLDCVAPIHTTVVFCTDRHAWTATLNGVVGFGPESHCLLSLNGVPVPKRVNGWLCPDAWNNMPWCLHSPSYSHWYTYIFEAWHVSPVTTSFALRVDISQTKEASVYLNGWPALWHLLCKSCPLHVDTPRRSIALSSSPMHVSSSCLRMELEPTRFLLLPSFLDSVRVIAQVDHKYIVCSCAESKTSLALLCLDQHAVDERVRLERDMSQFVMACIAERDHSKALEKPCTFSMALPLHVLTPMAFWGWDVRQGDAPMHWEVHAVPVITPIHADISTLTIQCAAWLAEADDMHVWLRTAANMEVGMIGAMRYLPPPLKEALASHACHTAIRTFAS